MWLPSSRSIHSTSGFSGITVSLNSPWEAFCCSAGLIIAPQPLDLTDTETPLGTELWRDQWYPWQWCFHDDWDLSLLGVKCQWDVMSASSRASVFFCPPPEHSAPSAIPSSFMLNMVWCIRWMWFQQTFVCESASISWNKKIPAHSWLSPLLNLRKHPREPKALIPANFPSLLC